MFEYSLSSFGKYKKHTFADENGNAFSLIPEFGASLINLTFLGTSVLDSYDTPEALTENKWSKGIFLFPYPNRLRDGKYSHLGEDYQFDINNAATGNSIHGFGKNVPMHVTETRVTKNYAYINCRWKHDGTTKAYPFPFVIDISFKMSLLSDENIDDVSGIKKKLSSVKLQIRMKFKNKAKTSIPVGLGWHPYFILTPDVGNTDLKMPPNTQIIEIDERMLPTGKKENYTAFETLKPIGNTTLDNGFLLSQSEHNKVATVIACHTLFSTNFLQFWQETGPGKFNFLQVFTPPNRKSIAIEPMTCNIDAFNNKDGLVLLSPDAVLKGKFGIIFSKINR